MKNRTGKRFSVKIALNYLLLSILAAISIFPLYWMYVIGSNHTSDVNNIPPKIIPGPNFIENIKKVFGNIDFFQAILNSLIVSITVTLSVLFFCSLAGFAFAKLKFKGRNILFGFILATMMIPTQLGLIPQYIIMGKLGWINDLRAVIVPSMVTAFGVFLMRQNIMAVIHDDLIAAARIDGCSSFRIYWNIVIPVIKPSIATLGLLTFMQVWNDFMWPLVVLKDSSVQTIQIALKNLNGAYEQDYSMILSGTFLSTLPLLLIFILLSKQVIAGLTDGSIKN